MSLGHLVDVPDARDFKYEDIVPGVYGSFRRTPDLRDLRRGMLEQGNPQACVAFSIARAIHITQVRDSLGAHTPEPEIPSPSFIYYNARAQELIGKPPSMSPLPDRGCYPRLALKGVQTLGYVPWGDCPYQERTVNTRPRMKLYTEAFDQKGLRYYRISASGQERVDQVEHALSLGYPVIFGMMIDLAYTKLGRAPADSVDMKKLLGGHMQCAMAIDSSGVVVENWWGKDWGLGDGTGRLTARLFGSDVVNDVYVVQAASIPENT